MSSQEKPDVVLIGAMIVLIPIFMAFDIWEGCKRAWSGAVYTWREIKQMGAER